MYTAACTSTVGGWNRCVRVALGPQNCTQRALWLHWLCLESFLVRKSACSGCWLLPAVHGLCQLCAWRLMSAAVQTMELDQKGSKRLVLRWRLATALHCTIWTSDVSGFFGGVLVVRVIELRCCSASG